MLASTKTDLQKLATGTGIAFIGAVLGNGLVYLYGIIIGRFLGAETLGLYFLALVVMQLTNTICRVGLPEGLLRFVAIRHGEGDLSREKGHIFSALLVVGATSVMGATLLFLFADSLSVYVFKQPELAFYLKWFAAALPFFSIFVVLLNAIQALGRVDLVVLNRDLIQPIIMFVLAFGLFGMIPGSASFLMAFVGSMIIALGCAGYFLGRISSLLDRVHPAIFEWRILLAFSLPIAGSDLAHYFSRWSDTIILSFFRPTAEIGIYNAAVRTTLLLNLLAGSVNALYGPVIANHHNHGRYQEVQTILKILMRWCLTVALPIVFLTILLARDILSLWGPEFAGGDRVLVYLVVAQAIFIMSSLLAFTLLMCGRQYLEVGNTVLAAILNISMNLVLIPAYGITGAAISALSSQVFVFFVRWLEVGHVIGLNLYTLSYLKPVIALLPVLCLGLTLRVQLGPMGFALQAVSLGAMAGMFLLIGAGYLVVLYLLGIEKEDLLLWRGNQRRHIV